MEESSLQPWHLFTFFFLAFQAVVIYLRHLLLTTIAAVAFGAVTEVTSRYLLLAHLSPSASFPATSTSCSGGFWVTYSAVCLAALHWDIFNPT